MKYYVFRQQEGYGCDYTIGCGLSLKSLRATTKEAAIQEAVGITDDWKQDALDAVGDGDDLDDYLHDYIGDSSLRDVDPKNDRTMREITLLEVSSTTDLIPVMKAKLAEINQFRKELSVKAQERAELALYEKLKKKLGK